jgi:hypothetical protein
VLIESTSLTLKDKSTPPADPNHRKIVFKSSTLGYPPANQVVAPARGAPGDPTAGGAVLRVYNSNGTGEIAQATLPASGWTALDATPTGYKYRSASSTDAITRVLIRGNLLKIRGGRSQWTYALAQAPQVSIAVRVTMGGGFEWCANTTARASGNPPTTASNDRVDKFVGARSVPPPAACPPLP